jgi:hypothetical protein
MPRRKDLRNNRIVPSSEPDQLSRSTENGVTAKRFGLGDFGNGLEQSVLNAELTTDTKMLS